MSKLSTSPRRDDDWQPQLVRKTLAPVIPFKTLDAELVPALSTAAGGNFHLGLFKKGPDSRDRHVIDGLVVIALIVFAHATVIEYFHHAPPPPEKPKETQVEITLLAPPPPPVPPPPVVQPQPVPAPPKDAIPPKPKPKPKKIPPPVVEQPPVQNNAPVVPDAPPAPPVQAAPAPKPVEKVVQVSNADYLRRPEPEYPEDAQERGWSGKVMVKARILASGKPDDVQVYKSSGHASLDAAAVRAVKGSLFKPNMQGDTATIVTALIPISFQL
jgi:protein TonB